MADIIAVVALLFSMQQPLLAEGPPAPNPETEAPSAREARRVFIGLHKIDLDEKDVSAYSLVSYLVTQVQQRISGPQISFTISDLIGWDQDADAQRLRRAGYTHYLVVQVRRSPEVSEAVEASWNIGEFPRRDEVPLFSAILSQRTVAGPVSRPQDRSTFLQKDINGRWVPFGDTLVLADEISRKILSVLPRLRTTDSYLLECVHVHDSSNKGQSQDDLADPDLAPRWRGTVETIMLHLSTGLQDDHWRSLRPLFGSSDVWEMCGKGRKATADKHSVEADFYIFPRLVPKKASGHGRAQAFRLPIKIKDNLRERREAYLVSRSSESASFAFLELKDFFCPAGAALGDAELDQLAQYIRVTGLRATGQISHRSRCTCRKYK